jgi:putative transcriptional regulator
MSSKSADHRLVNQFLIAMPNMADPNFSRTVTYVFEHNEKGAMGIVINRPTKMQLAEVFQQLELPCEDAAIHGRPVLQGGPVHIEQGFVIHRSDTGGNGGNGKWDYSIHVSETVQITTSRDILAAMAQGKGPPSAIVALGYAGWGAGQLETELISNSWLTVDADDSVLFDIPFEQRWHAAVGLLGVDASRIGPDAGHA